MADAKKEWVEREYGPGAWERAQRATQRPTYAPEESAKAIYIKELEAKQRLALEEEEERRRATKTPILSGLIARLQNPVWLSLLQPRKEEETPWEFKLG